MFHIFLLIVLLYLYLSKLIALKFFMQVSGRRDGSVGKVLTVHVWILRAHANLDAGGKFCNPSTPKVGREVERRESQEAHCPSSLAYSAGDNEIAYLKQCRSGGWILEIILWLVHIYSGTWSHAFTHMSTSTHEHQHTWDLLCDTVNLVKK